MPPRAKKNSKPQKNKDGQFRIIGGEHGSRKLSFPDVEGLRPTTDRVRETVFNWLQHDLPGARVLDLFAGSGALGFEAASRGAGFVQFIELNAKAVSALRSNCALLGVAAEVEANDALRFIDQFNSELVKPFDLVFIDPPFRKDIVDKVLPALQQNGLLKAGAKVYLETETELNTVAIPAAWKELKSKTAGQVRYCLFATS